MSSSPPAPSKPETAAELLARLFPPLHRYWPHLWPRNETETGVSAQQAAFLLLDHREALYGGAAGGGKSDAILASALQYADVPGYAALILRRTFPELTGAGGLLARSHEWLAQTDAQWVGDMRTWRFPSGATLRFGHVESEDDRFKYDGQEYAYIGFDELTSFAETQYDWIGFSRARRNETFRQLNIPMRTRASATPTGAGYGWVKKRFITDRASDVVFIPARHSDNPGVDSLDYIESLNRLPEDTRRRLLDGDWDVFEGAAFASFDERIHVIPPIEIPAAWTRFESMDFGTANPTCVLAWAADYDGNLIIFDSYYSDRDTLVSTQAEAIKAKRETWWPKDNKGWLTQSIVSHADPSMWSRIGTTTRFGEPASIITELREHGIDHLTQANNKRRPGRVRILELLRPDADRPFPVWSTFSGERGSPRLFIVGENCPELVEQLQAAPANEKTEGENGIGEVVQGAWESQHGHAVAACRYGAMSWQSAPEPVRERPADPRAAALADMAERERQQDLDLDLDS